MESTFPNRKFPIGNTSTNGGFSIATLVYRSVCLLGSWNVLQYFWLDVHASAYTWVVNPSKREISIKCAPFQLLKCSSSHIITISFSSAKFLKKKPPWSDEKIAPKRSRKEKRWSSRTQASESWFTFWRFWTYPRWCTISEPSNVDLRWFVDDCRYPSPHQKST